MCRNRFRFSRWLVLAAGVLLVRATSAQGPWILPSEADPDTTSDSAAEPTESDAADSGTVRSIPWNDSFKQAQLTAAAVKKPLLVDFTADWCGFCKKLDRETFSDELVIRFVVEHFIAVKVDTTKDPETAAKFGVSALPTIVFLSPTGEELQRIQGFRPAEDFLKEARKSAQSSETLALLKHEADQNPEDLEAQRAYARALFAAGNLEEAERLIRKSLDAAPTDAPARAGLLVDLADALRLEGKYEEARAAYAELLAMPAEVAAGEARAALLPLSKTLILLKRHDEAVPILDRLLALETPGDERLEALFLRGYVHAVLKDVPAALTDLRLARQEDPEGRWGLRAGWILDVVEKP